MGMVFKQLAGTAASYVSACNPESHTVDSGTGKWGAQVDGSTAATQYSLAVPAGSTGSGSVRLLAQWESVSVAGGDPGLLSVWPAGDWICRLNVSQANANVFWDSVQICALHPDGATTTQIASMTGIAESLDSTGTYSETVTTSSNTVVPQGSTVLWSYFFGQTISGGVPNAFKIRSNKNLATPIAAADPRSEFRPQMLANRMQASNIANREFARSMLESSGAHAWAFACAMPERYHTSAMDITSNAITQGHVRRERIARAAQRAASIATLSGMQRPRTANAQVQGSLATSSAVEQVHIGSGSTAV